MWTTTRDFVSERLDKLGAEIGLESPEEYTAHLARQYELFSGILKMRETISGASEPLLSRLLEERWTEKDGAVWSG